MSDFLTSLLDHLAALWPLKIVYPWEVGVLIRAGRVVGVRHPGVYFVWWWFEDLEKVPVVPAVISSARQDVTAKDGTVISFSASAKVQVADAIAAHTTVDSYKETVRETVEAVLADRIAQVDPERLAPEKRGRLLADLTRWVSEETVPYGVVVRDVRFNNFVTNVRTIRLVQDMTGSTDW